MTPGRRPEFGVFTEFSQSPGVSEATAFVLAAPLAIAAALAGRTSRIKLGIAVQVLAQPSASHRGGRGHSIPYSESRDRPAADQARAARMSSTMLRAAAAGSASAVMGRPTTR